MPIIEESGVMKMKISTIIPVYNAEKYIARCLDSVLAQGIEEQEIICVDDGSSDHSLEILRDYERKHDKIHVLTQQNSYAGVARNNGLLAAIGEYVHFMDADDYILPGAYIKVYETAKTNSADYVKTKSMTFDMKSGTMCRKNYFSMEDFPDNIFGKVYSFDECQEILLKTARAPWTSFVKRSYLMENNIRFNSLKCINDHSFYIDVITHANRIVICNCYMVCYQTNNKESLMGIRYENFICLIQSYQIIREMVSDVPDYLRKKILGFEFRSFVGWYAKLNAMQRKEVQNIVKPFLDKFDWNDLDGSSLTASTIAPLYELLNMKIPVECRIRDLAALKEIYSNLDKLILYGAGTVCRALLQYLEKGKFGLNKIFCIIVAEKTCNPDHVMGIPVHSMEECNLKSADGIIIATFENVQFPIYHRLSASVSCNIRTVTDELYTLL